MKQQAAEIKNLKTIKNYAGEEGVTTSYIYKLIKDERMTSFDIDGVQFIDVKAYPSIPVPRRRR